MKTAEDFKKQAKKLNFINKKWTIHHCSLCGYPCGYIIDHAQDLVEYDSGCDCIAGALYTITERDWQSIADFYNHQLHPDTITKMNEFWSFEENPEKPNNF